MRSLIATRLIKYSGILKKTWLIKHYFNHSTEKNAPI